MNTTSTNKPRICIPLRGTYAATHTRRGYVPTTTIGAECGARARETATTWIGIGTAAIYDKYVNHTAAAALAAAATPAAVPALPPYRPAHTFRGRRTRVKWTWQEIDADNTARARETATTWIGIGTAAIYDKYVNHTAAAALAAAATPAAVPALPPYRPAYYRRPRREHLPPVVKINGSWTTAKVYIGIEGTIFVKAFTPNLSAHNAVVAKMCKTESIYTRPQCYTTTTGDPAPRPVETIIMTDRPRMDPAETDNDNTNTNRRMIKRPEKYLLADNGTTPTRADMTPTALRYTTQTARSAAYTADQTAAHIAANSADTTGPQTAAALIRNGITIAAAVNRNAYDPGRKYTSGRKTAGRPDNTAMHPRLAKTLAGINQYARVISIPSNMPDIVTTAKQAQEYTSAQVTKARKEYEDARKTDPKSEKAKRAKTKLDRAQDARETAKTATDAARTEENNHYSNNLPEGLDTVQDAIAAALKWYRKGPADQIITITVPKSKTVTRLDSPPEMVDKEITISQAIYREVAAKVNAEKARNEKESGYTYISVCDIWTDNDGTDAQKELDRILYRAGRYTDITIDPTTAAAERAEQEIIDKLTADNNPRAAALLRARLRGMSWAEAAETIGVKSAKSWGCRAARAALESAAREIMPNAPALENESESEQQPADSTTSTPAPAPTKKGSAPKGVIAVDPDSNKVVAAYASIKAAARAIGVNHTSILRAAKSDGCKLVHGLQWFTAE